MTTTTHPSVGRATARIIAFYLPQFHPIPENDAWWGPGFTEWTNAAKAKPLFKGHYQPHVPADLGFYDLRLPEARAAQAQLARDHGIHAFCYYHYWFAGKRLLERPFTEVLRSGQPDFPFCLCWANQTWSGIWHGCPDRMLIEQTYPGREDYRAHFDALLPAFLDQRYVTIDGKPLFLIYCWHDIPDVRRVIGLWRELSTQSGLPGLYVVAVLHHKGPWIPEKYGFDACVRSYLRHRPERWMSLRRWIGRAIPLAGRLARRPTVYSYEKALMDVFADEMGDVMDYPCVMPNWDNTPRVGAAGIVLHGSTPELFRIQVRRSLELTQGKPPEHRVVFVKSWNEWAEGNHLEPDLRFGKGYLEVLREEVGRLGASGSGVCEPDGAQWLAAS